MAHFSRTAYNSKMAASDKASRLPDLVANQNLAVSSVLIWRFEELLARVGENRPGEDVEILRRAFDFAAEQHRSQTRESGEPYLSHPLEVAHILADLRLDVTTVCAALLHDIVEDTRMPTSEIAAQFGSDV